MTFLSSTPLSIEDLLERTGRGDRGAFAQLYERTSGKLFAVCVGILRSRGLAEEALQDGFVRVWRNAHTFDRGKASAMTWLISVTRNRALSYRSKTGRLVPVEDETIDAMRDLDRDPEGYDAADLQALKRCLAELGENQRHAVTRAYLYGDTHRELAGAMDAPIGTIKTWLRRALEQLRLCLDDEAAR